MVTDRTEDFSTRHKIRSFCLVPCKRRPKDWLSGTAGSGSVSCMEKKKTKQLLVEEGIVRFEWKASYMFT